MYLMDSLTYFVRGIVHPPTYAGIFAGDNTVNSPNVKELKN
jgi:hypothetical protein